MKFQAVENIRARQDVFLYGIVPIGVAARDIPKGAEINYDPNKNTVDVIVFEFEQPEKSGNANPP